MKINLISLMRAGADALEAGGDECGRSYALHEAANNMIELLTGAATLAEFQACYVAGHIQPLDLNVRFPNDDDDLAAREAGE